MEGEGQGLRTHGNPEQPLQHPPATRPLLLVCWEPWPLATGCQMPAWSGSGCLLPEGPWAGQAAQPVSGFREDWSRAGSWALPAATAALWPWGIEGSSPGRAVERLI